jgi:hypothetical protein
MVCLFPDAYGGVAISCRDALFRKEAVGSCKR